MATRILLVIAYSALMGGLSSADDVHGTTNIGDYVAVELTGDAALKYSRISTRPIADANRSGLTIHVIAELHKTSDAANVRLIHHAETTINTKRYRLTLAGTLPANELLPRLYPPGPLFLHHLQPPVLPRNPKSKYCVFN